MSFWKRTKTEKSIKCIVKQLKNKIKGIVLWTIKEKSLHKNLLGNKRIIGELKLRLKKNCKRKSSFLERKWRNNKKGKTLKKKFLIA